MEQWRNMLNIKQINKLNLHTRVEEGSQIITNTITAKHFTILLDSYHSIVEEELRAENLRNQNICRIIFDHLKERVRQKCIYLKIKENNKKRSISKHLKYWKKLSSTSRGCALLLKWANKVSLTFIKTEANLLKNA